MTFGGGVFMALSWGLVIGLTVYCFRKILKDR
jgi:hypothetical protein